MDILDCHRHFRTGVSILIAHRVSTWPRANTSNRSLICAIAPNSVTLIVGRAVAGIGVGGLFSGAIVILAYCLPLRKRPAAFGLIGGMWGIASVAGVSGRSTPITPFYFQELSVP